MVRAMASSTQQLLADIEAFLDAHNMRAAYFGRDAVNDTSLVYRLRKGKTVRLETADRIRAFMATVKGAQKGRRTKKTKEPA